MDTQIDITILITFQEAAEILKVARPRVYQLVDAGKLHVIEIAGKRFLDRDEVEELAQIPRKAGRPRKE